MKTLHRNMNRRQGLQDHLRVCLPEATLWPPVIHIRDTCKRHSCLPTFPNIPVHSGIGTKSTILSSSPGPDKHSSWGPPSLDLWTWETKEMNDLPPSHPVYTGEEVEDNNYTHSQSWEVRKSHQSITVLKSRQENVGFLD